MAKPSDSTIDTQGVVSPSPSRGINKREREDDEDEATRLVVLQPTTNPKANENEETPSMKTLVQKDLQSGNQETIEKALYLIRVKVRAHANGCAKAAGKEFYRLGGHSILVFLLRTVYPDCVTIQEQGIAVIINLAFLEEFKTVLAEVDTISAVLAAMDKFQDERTIQYYGLQALINLIDGNSTNTKNLVSGENGIPVILEGMNTFLDDAEIARKGCSIVASCCRIEELRKPIFGTDALTALAKARDTYKGNYEIRKYVTQVLKAFVEYTYSESP